MKELSNWFIVKAWLGHYITWGCMWGMFRLKKERRLEAEHQARLDAIKAGTTEEVVPKAEDLDDNMLEPVWYEPVEYVA